MGADAHGPAGRAAASDAENPGPSPQTPALGRHYTQFANKL